MNLNIGLWKPSIGDTSLIGWWIVFSYYLCSCICLFKAISCAVSAKPFLRFWMFLFVVLVLLGINKQFNLLSAVTEFGRIIFGRLNLMEYHRFFQAVLMAVFFIAGCLFVVGFYRRKIRGLRPYRRLIIVGVIYLIFFVVERSISLHQFGTLLSQTIAGIRVNWIAELGGIYWVLFWIILDTLSHDRKQKDSGNLFNSETP